MRAKLLGMYDDDPSSMRLGGIGVKCSKYSQPRLEIRCTRPLSEAAESGGVRRRLDLVKRAIRSRGSVATPYAVCLTPSQRSHCTAGAIFSVLGAKE